MQGDGLLSSGLDAFMNGISVGLFPQVHFAFDRFYALCLYAHVHENNVMVTEAWHSFTLVDKRWSIGDDDDVECVVTSGGKVHNLFEATSC